MAKNKKTKTKKPISLLPDVHYDKVEKKPLHFPPTTEPDDDETVPDDGSVEEILGFDPADDDEPVKKRARKR